MATRSSPEVPPALSRDEWARITHDSGRLSLRFPGPDDPPAGDAERVIRVLPDIAAQVMAVANAALQDDSPYKFRSRHIAALTNVVQGIRDSEDLTVLDELGAILVALLPPE